MWGHTQPHKVGSSEKLIKRMERNRNFAMQHGIPTDSGKLFYDIDIYKNSREF